MRFSIFRLMDYKPGCVDFLGTVEAASLDEAESFARLIHPVDYGLDERLDVEEDDETEPVCSLCGAPATCHGTYEGKPSYACDDCCGHGCEDGVCRPVG